MAREEPNDHYLYSQDRQSPLTASPLPDGMVIKQKVEPRYCSPRIKVSSGFAATSWYCQVCSPDLKS
jgi:hypothetical protein